MPRQETEHERFRRGSRRRYVAAIVCTAVLLLLYVWLGPDRDDVKRRFEFSGSEGPLRLMPELSIDRGDDARFQEEMRRQDLPQPAPDYEVIDPDQDGPVPVPEAVESSETAEEVVDPVLDAEVEAFDQIEMTLPAQTNPWFKLVQMIRPRYPGDATEQDRMLVLVTVVVAFFVGTDGTIQGSYIISNTGGEAFARVALKAVNQWLYEPIGAEVAPAGFWNRLTINFRQPAVVLQR